MTMGTDIYSSTEDYKVINVSVVPVIDKRIVTVEYAAQMNFVINGVNILNYNGGIKKGGAIQMENSGWVRPFFAVKNSSFQNCNSLASGGTIYMNDADTLEISDSTFKNSRSNGDNGSVVSIENSRIVNISNVRSELCFANQSGTFYMNNISEQTIIDNLSILNSETLSNGGGIYQSELGKKLIIQNSLFSNVSSRNSKGGVIFSNISDSTSLDNVEIYNCKAKSDGGSLYVESPGNTSISNSIIQGSVSTNGCGGAIKIIGKGTNATLKMNNVTLNQIESNLGDGGAINAFSLKEITLDNINVSSNICRNGNGGFGSFESNRGNLTINGSNFYNITSQYAGGVCNITQYHTVELTKSHFERITSNNGGGCFFINTIQGTFRIFECNFAHCMAKNSYGGVIYATTQIANLLVNHVQFYNCSSYYTGTISCSSISTQGKIMNTCSFQCYSLSANGKQFVDICTSSGSLYMESVSMNQNGKASVTNTQMVYFANGYHYFNKCNTTNNKIASNMLYFYNVKDLSMNDNTIINNTGNGNYKLYLYIYYGFGIANQNLFIGNTYSTSGIGLQLTASTDYIRFENCIFQGNSGTLFDNPSSSNGIRYIQNSYISHNSGILTTGSGFSTNNCVQTTNSITKTHALTHYSTFYCPGVDIEQNEVPCQTIPSFVEIIQFPSPTGCIYTHEEQNYAFTATIFHILQTSIISIMLL